jgi:hypothetical protein
MDYILKAIYEGEEWDVVDLSFERGSALTDKRPSWVILERGKKRKEIIIRDEIQLMMYEI